MATLINNAGVQHYANKMCDANNRKVGSKSLPTALNDIDSLIDEMKTQFDAEYGSALDMKLSNNENIFSVGAGTDINKRSEVENGFTDVELSGNSLVNLFTTTQNFTSSGNNITRNGFVITLSNTSSWSKTGNRLNLKPNTTYYAQITCENKSDSNCSSYIRLSHNLNHSTSVSIPKFPANSTTTQNSVFTTDDTGLVLLSVERGEGTNESIFYDIILLEGDWTNKPIPQYFQGLKSIGEKDDGNHKINITSKGKNLIDIRNFKSTNDTTKSRNVTVELKGSKIILSSNKTSNYTCSTIKMDVNQIKGKSIIIYNDGVKSTNNPNNGRIIQFNIEKTDGTWEYIGSTKSGTKVNIPQNIKRVEFCLYTNNSNIIDVTNTVEIDNLMLCYLDTPQTPYELYKEDKKEILLNEPLRGLPNGVKDTIEKINGEWKIVRRCGEIIFNGEENWILSDYNGETTSRYRLNYLNITDIAKKINSIGICNTIPVYSNSYWNQDFEMIENDTTFINIRKKIYNNLNEFKEWLSQNPTKVVYELETSIIEDISPITLQCWKNGTISIDEVLPVETTHTVALNKPAQIKRNIEELTALRKRVEALEDFYDKVALEQSHQLSLISHSIELDYNI